MVNGNEVGKNMFLSFVVPVYKVYISTHRPWGFRAMCGLQKLIALKHSVN